MLLILAVHAASASSFMPCLKPCIFLVSGEKGEQFLVVKGKPLALQGYFSLGNMLMVLRRTLFFLFYFYFTLELSLEKDFGFLSFSGSLEKG